jgi:2-C-methyl-D-erythritol 4-phosphate cytidylyltransferase
MDAIILAAGLGKRAKLNYPKQYFRLAGKPLIIIILDLFLKIKEINNIIVVVIPGIISEFEELLKSYYFNLSKIKIVEGGNIRQESVLNGLRLVETERVLIHEAVRPFITKQHVLDLIGIDSDVVVPCVSIVPTISTKDGKYIDRDILVNVQLPQVFNTDILKKAHYKALEKDYSDDSSLVWSELGIKPIFIKGLEENIKITTPIDIKVSEVLYEELSDNNWWV